MTDFLDKSYRRYISGINKDALSAGWPRFGRAVKRKMILAKEKYICKSNGSYRRYICKSNKGAESASNSHRRYICENDEDALSASWSRSGENLNVKSDV